MKTSRLTRTVVACAVVSLTLAACTSTANTETVVEHYFPVIYSSPEVFLDTADVVVDATVESSEVRVVDPSTEVRLDRAAPSGRDPDTNPEFGAVPGDPSSESIRTQVYTYYTLKVHKARVTDLDPGDQIVVRIPGGEHEGVRYIADVFPVLDKGERYVLVLAEAVEGVYAPLSPGQATYVRAKSGALEPLSTTATLRDVEGDGSRDTRAEVFDRTINEILSVSLFD